MTQRSLPTLPAKLPCFPCPHGSHCCNWGSAVVADEPDQIRAAHGDAALVWDEEESEWRTSVVNGTCFFQKDNGCSIHDKPYYPRICRGFPWVDGDKGGPYLYDLTICPELSEFGDGEGDAEAP